MRSCGSWRMNEDEVVILGLWSPTSQMGGRVIWTGGGLEPKIIVYETDMHR